MQTETKLDRKESYKIVAVTTLPFEVQVCLSDEIGIYKCTGIYTSKYACMEVLGLVYVLDSYYFNFHIPTFDLLTLTFEPLIQLTQARYKGDIYKFIYTVHLQNSTTQLHPILTNYSIILTNYSIPSCMSYFCCTGWRAAHKSSK